MIRLLIYLCCLCCLGGCRHHQAHFSIPKGRADARMEVTTTGYCDCRKCCGWERNWLGRPVFAYGPNKGKPKDVGVTATGTRARHGVVAVDPRVFAYGTIFKIPGYGWARAEDCGGAIKGMHLDLFFDSHEEALEWGRRKKVILVWR